jgi:MFS family permease
MMHGIVKAESSVFSFKGLPLFLLVAVSVVSQIDRSAINLLIEPIKRDFHASDSQMGLLAGFFYVLFYVFGMIPIGRLADRISRPRIIAVCLGVWSIGTVMSGFARSYAHLAIGRVVVATGEGGVNPPAYSLISDLYPTGMRTRANALFSAGSAIGAGLSLMLGGALVSALGWRGAFFVLGLPGLLLVPAVLLGLPEPRRHSPVDRGPHPPFGRAILLVVKSPTFRRLAVIAVGGSITGYGMLAWAPSFLVRVHGLSQHEVGFKLGMATVVGLLGGNITSGFLADLLGKADIRWRVWVAGLGQGMCIPVGLVSFFANDANLSIVAYGISFFFLSFWPPVVMTCALTVSDQRTKAVASACIYFFFQVGGALGPFLMGILNDALASTYGPEAIRYSLATSLLGCVVGMISCAVIGNGFRREYEQVQAKIQQI